MSKSKSRRSRPSREEEPPQEIEIRNEDGTAQEEQVSSRKGQQSEEKEPYQDRIARVDKMVTELQEELNDIEEEIRALEAARDRIRRALGMREDDQPRQRNGRSRHVTAGQKPRTANGKFNTVVTADRVYKVLKEAGATSKDNLVKMTAEKGKESIATLLKWPDNETTAPIKKAIDGDDRFHGVGKGRGMGYYVK